MLSVPKQSESHKGGMLAFDPNSYLATPTADTSALLRGRGVPVDAWKNASSTRSQNTIRLKCEFGPEAKIDIVVGPMVRQRDDSHSVTRGQPRRIECSTRTAHG